MNYLLDTTILIGHLRGKSAAVQFVLALIENGHRLGICCVNIAELYARVLTPTEEYLANRLTDRLELYNVNLQIARRAGLFWLEFSRRGISLQTTDCIIAATAIAENAILVTANTRHFPMPELQVVRHS